MTMLKVAIVGCGKIADAHAFEIRRAPGCELVGTCDREELMARQLAERFHIPRSYSRLDALLEDARPDVVHITTPPQSHFEIGKRCLEAGCQVLVEKPITTTVAEADELVHLSRERGLTLMVGHLERFNSAMEELKSRVTQPRFIESHRLSFFKERGTDVDVVLDLMIHDLDHVLNLVPSPVAEIRAAGISVLTDRVDLANVRLEFESGCIANLTASRMSFKSMRKFRLFQPEAYLAVDFENRELTAASRKDGAMGPLPGVALETRRFSQEDVLLKEITAFVQTIQDGGEAPIPGEAGRAALDLALSINAAMKKAKG